MKIWVEEKYVRAVSGGVGFAKSAGNYGGAMYATAQAKKRGYDQVLWTDPYEHKYVQECGTMNVFFIIGNKAITPDLKEGTILAGVTRNSVMTLLQERGLIVEERPIDMDEIAAAYKSGQLKEVFGTGTAATISLIKELCYKEMVMQFDVNAWTIAPGIKQQLADIREGRIEDTHGWMQAL
jgi:branched-chain amino acid aminotransferase